jgi:hypothetical protein
MATTYVGWDFAEGDHPMGCPVGVWQLDHGSVPIIEDHNGSLLRLAREQSAPNVR